MLRGGQIHVARRTVPELPREGLSEFAFVPLGFAPSHDNTMTPTYPIGLPLLVAATSCVTGWSAAPHVTMWLHAIAGVALMFALGRTLGLPFSWTAFGALLLATSPVYVFISLPLMSDVPALVWSTIAVLSAWRGRFHAGWAAAAGASLALAVLVRPTNLLAFIPVAIALGIGWRRWLALVAAGLPGAIALVAYNHAAYGHALATGYGSMTSYFSAGLWLTTLTHYARWLPVALTPVIVLALGLPWLGRNRWHAVLAAWILAYGGFYLFYSFTHEAWWYLRFLLPAFPPLIAAALLVGKMITDTPPLARWHRHAPVATAAFVALALGWSLAWGSLLRSYRIGRDEHSYLAATDWARAHLPANALLVVMQTSGALYYYTEFTFVRWDQLRPRDVAALEQLAAKEGRPLVAMLFPDEQKEVLWQRLPGRWIQLGAVPHVTFWRRDAPAPAAP